MYSVKITNNGDYYFKVRSKDYEFTVDTKGKGATPPDTLLASLGTCIGVYLRKYAEGAKISLPEFDISVQAEFSQEKPVCFRNIFVEVDLKGNRPDERRLKSIKEFIENCPVHMTLKQNPDIKIRLN